MRGKLYTCYFFPTTFRCWFFDPMKWKLSDCLEHRSYLLSFLCIVWANLVFDLVHERIVFFNNTILKSYDATVSLNAFPAAYVICLKRNVRQ